MVQEGAEDTPKLLIIWRGHVRTRNHVCTYVREKKRKSHICFKFCSSVQCSLDFPPKCPPWKIRPRHAPATDLPRPLPRWFASRETYLLQFHAPVSRCSCMRDCLHTSPARPRGLVLEEGRGGEANAWGISPRRRGGSHIAHCQRGGKALGGKGMKIAGARGKMWNRGIRQFFLAKSKL